MRRPSFCCDHDKPPDQASCPHQGGGALARVRRFLSISLGRRHHHGATTSTPSSSSRHHLHHHKPCSSSEHHCPLNQLVTQATSVLGLPLDQVMMRQGEDHALGVPVLVHVLCCYMLSHGVDHDVLVTEDWMVDDVRLRLVSTSDQGHTFNMKEADSATAAAGLLRLFLHDLPHPLLHPQLMQPLLDLCQELDHVTSRDSRDEIGGRIWNFLNHRLSSHNLNLMSYLAAFLHQLYSSTHATSPVTSSSLARVLGRVLVGRTGSKPDLSTSTQIAELLILHYTSVFHNSSEEKSWRLLRPTSLPCELPPRYVPKSHQLTQPKIRPWCFVHVVSDVSVVSSPDSGAEDSRGEDDDSGAPLNEGEGEGEDEEDTTTTTDTDDFRSLPVSPIKSSFSDLPLDSSPPLDPPSPLDNLNLNLNDATTTSSGWERRSPSRGWDHQVAYSGSTNRAGGSTSRPGCGRRGQCRGSSWAQESRGESQSSLPLDLSSPVTHDPRTKGGPHDPGTHDPGTAVTFDPGTAVPHDPTSRDPAAPSPSATDADAAGVAAYPPQRKRKEHNTEGEPEHDPKVIRSNNELSSHVNDIDGISPYCKTYLPLLSDTLTSPDDSVREDDDGISAADDDDKSSQSADSSCVSVSEYWATGGESGSVASSPHEERRWSERSLPLAPQTTRRHRRKTRRKHSDKDGGLKFQSSEEEGKLTEEEDYVESSSPQEHPQYHNDNSNNFIKKGSGPLSDLLASNEPVTTSDRGSWGLRRDMSHYDSWHRTAHHYNRYEESSELPSWYNSHEEQPIVSPRSFHEHSVQPASLQEEHFSSSGHSAVKILMKNINSIKKKIKKFEEEFEAAFGYRPSHSDKMKHKDIKKHITELSKARKELKQMKEDVAGIVSAQTVFPLSLLRCQESTQNSTTLPTQTTQEGEARADTLRQVEERLQLKRSVLGRPTDLKDMTCAEIQDEKTALQKALLYYESVHGRPSTREDRDLARPLYDRYRLVKRSIVRTNSRKDNTLELAPILEHEAMDFTLASPQHRSSLQETEINVNVEVLKETEAESLSPVSVKSSSFGSEESLSSLLTTREESTDLGRPTIPLGDLHALPLTELRERKKEAREEKKRLRRALRDYEEKFERDTGRKVQKEDRGVMEPTYVNYKHAKAKLRLLEALISKHEPCRL